MDRDYIIDVLTLAKDKASEDWSRATANSNTEKHAGLCRDMFRYLINAMKEVKYPEPPKK